MEVLTRLTSPKEGPAPDVRAGLFCDGLNFRHTLGSAKRPHHLGTSSANYSPLACAAMSESPVESLPPNPMTGLFSSHCRLRDDASSGLKESARGIRVAPARPGFRMLVRCFVAKNGVGPQIGTDGETIWLSVSFSDFKFTMHKHPTTVTERFNAFFTTRRLVMHRSRPRRKLPPDTGRRS